MDCLWSSFTVLSGNLAFFPLIEYVSQLTYDIVERISETPLGEQLQQQMKNQQLFLELTELYNKARYSSLVDKEDAARAQKLWESIKNISPNNIEDQEQEK